MFTMSPIRGAPLPSDDALAVPASEAAALDARFWWLMRQRRLGEASAADLQSEATDYLAAYFAGLTQAELVK